MPDQPFLGLSPTQWIAITTVVLTCIAAIQACIYAAMHATTQRVERAYLTVSEFSHSNLGPDRDVGLDVRVMNRGRTPAKRVRCLMKYIIGVEPSVGDYRDAISIYTDTISPTANWPAVISMIPFTEEKWAAVRAGSEHLYVWGYVEYRDAFNKKRTTRFGSYYRSDVGILTIETPGFNDAD